MSIQETQVSTPSSTTGSTANSPAASHPPPTPLTPGDAPPYMALPTLPTINENDSKSPTTGTAPNANSGSNNNSNASTNGPPKRKPSRRANTAERRATHNAVERQRRETLNGRFLDLAALLPNLATVRRPSKSAIVNSSIALIHSHRRQRILAARELRLLRAESDALRRENNEWRDRAGLPRIEEPPRSQEFIALLAMGAEDGTQDGEGWWDAPGLGEMGEEERRAYELVMRGAQDEDDEGMDGEEDDYAAAVAARNMGGFNKLPGAVNNIALQHIAPRFPGQGAAQPQQQQPQMSFARGPASAGPAIGFESMPSHPALGAGVHTMYEPNGHPHGATHALPVHPAFDHVQHTQHQDKLAAWGMNQGMYGNQVAQPQWAHQVAGNATVQQNAQALFTPPGTAGSAAGNNNGAPSPINGGASFGQQASLFGPQGALGHGHVYASPELDDASSVGSVDGATRSVGGSPGPASSQSGNGTSGSFDMGMNLMAAAYGRKPSLSLNVAGSEWSGAAAPSQPMAVPVSAGGGGGGRHMNAMMAMMM